jgi:hypothetical protein
MVPTSIFILIIIIAALCVGGGLGLIIAAFCLKDARLALAGMWPNSISWILFLCVYLFWSDPYVWAIGVFALLGIACLVCNLKLIKVFEDKKAQKLAASSRFGARKG